VNNLIKIYEMGWQWHDIHLKFHENQLLGYMPIGMCEHNTIKQNLCMESGENRLNVS
jgi:hypothetical protein